MKGTPDFPPISWQSTIRARASSGVKLRRRQIGGTRLRRSPARGVDQASGPGAIYRGRETRSCGDPADLGQAVSVICLAAWSRPISLSRRRSRVRFMEFEEIGRAHPRAAPVPGVEMGRGERIEVHRAEVAILRLPQPGTRLPRRLAGRHPGRSSVPSAPPERPGRAAAGPRAAALGIGSGPRGGFDSVFAGCDGTSSAAFGVAACSAGMHRG